MPSGLHENGGLGGKNPALCLSGYFTVEVLHIGDISDVSAARHGMNVPVVLRDGFMKLRNETELMSPQIETGNDERAISIIK